MLALILERKLILFEIDKNFHIGLIMAEKAKDEKSPPEKSPRKQPRQFKKCKSATFTLDGMNYVIGKAL